MSRGNQKKRIFQDEDDYQTFLYYIKRAHELFPFYLISYCFMTNHIHMQVITIEDPPGKIMHCILSNYSKYYNKKYGYVGHLFQGRYIGENIESLPYMLHTSRYIHLNPVVAKIVEKPAQYKWSSYPVFIGKKSFDLVNEEKILLYFGLNTKEMIENYKYYVEREECKVTISDEVSRFEEQV